MTPPLPKNLGKILGKNNYFHDKCVSKVLEGNLKLPEILKELSLYWPIKITFSEEVELYVNKYSVDNPNPSDHWQTTYFYKARGKTFIIPKFFISNYRLCYLPNRATTRGDIFPIHYLDKIVSYQLVLKKETRPLYRQEFLALCESKYIGLSHADDLWNTQELERKDLKNITKEGKALLEIWDAKVKSLKDFEDDLYKDSKNERIFELSQGGVTLSHTLGKDHIRYSVSTKISKIPKVTGTLISRNQFIPDRKDPST